VSVTPNGPWWRFNVSLGFGPANARVGYARSILSAISRSIKDINRYVLRGIINRSSDDNKQDDMYVFSKQKNVFLAEIGCSILKNLSVSW
jgi:hypothetical protein